MEDWESVLSGSIDVSPGQEQTFLRCIMGHVEDPSMGSLNKALHIDGAAAAPEIEFTTGFGTHVDQGFGAGARECFLPNFPRSGLASNPRYTRAGLPSSSGASAAGPSGSGQNEACQDFNIDFIFL